MTIRRERLERKLEQRKEWAEKAKAASQAESEKAFAAIAGISPGQPILVDHHSAGRHRAALRRHDSAMHRCVERGKMAEHLEEKAEGLAAQLNHDIYSVDPDALEALEEKIAILERERDTS